MTKKNIRPQQVAPVQRETTATFKDQSGQVTPLKTKNCGTTSIGGKCRGATFAGDDAE